MPAGVRADADAVVVIAVAPTPVAHPVAGRVTVICEYLAARGFRVYAVHARSLREGSVWTGLNGPISAGVVPAPRPSVRTPHRPQWPRIRAAGASRRLLVAYAVTAALVFAAPSAVSAPPPGQPGVGTEPRSPGQAGVTPRSADPAPSSERPDPSGRVVSQPSTVTPAGPMAGSAQPVPMPAPPAGNATVEVDDSVRIGAAALPRPDWLSSPIAARERAWNSYLAGQAATAVEQAGLADPSGAEAVFGTVGGQPVQAPQELVWATEPQELALLVAEAAEPVAALDPQTGGVIETILTQLPGDGR
ncbi:hypothetical protein [Nocardia brasiliensis]|uniref:hypothetical protein n=1 Tax=Nocardia brasiliensis TaxID=37326 RepID=UPI00366BDC66